MASYWKNQHFLAFFQNRLALAVDSRIVRALESLGN
jgi:hypothetical protein